MKNKNRSANFVVLSRALNLLTLRDRQRLALVFILQVLLGLVDLLGVALVGVLGALTVSGIQSKSPSGVAWTIVNVLGISQYKFQTQAAILGLTAGFFLIARTILSIYTSRRTLFFLSRKGSELSTKIIATLFRKPLAQVYSRTSQETLYIVTTGVTQIMVGILGTTLTLSADTFLVLIMSVGLFVVEPIVALISTLFFTSFAFLLYFFMKNKTYQLGLMNSQLTVSGNEMTLEALASYREATVRGTRQHYAKKIGLLRISLADTLAELAFMPSISKYAIETALVLGTLLLSAIQFYLFDASHAIATLSIFLAAGSRIAPAILRIQQAALQIKGAAANSNPTLDLIDTLTPLAEAETVNNPFKYEHFEFSGQVKLSNVSFTYSGNDFPTLEDISMSIKSGEFVAIVGPSGAGKSTLVDVILGVAEPSEGIVEVSGNRPSKAILDSPGAISYMPQEAFLANTTILENILLGYERNEVPSVIIDLAIRRSFLKDFIDELPDGLDTLVGERGSRLSGGQRQRIAIARSLLTQPKLLILDEATSALDSNSEQMITKAILELKGRTTLIVIAHRLSTVKEADKVIYIENGKILTTGTFAEVRENVKNFDNQAKLMGL